MNQYKIKRISSDNAPFNKIGCATATTEDHVRLAKKQNVAVFQQYLHTLVGQMGQSISDVMSCGDMKNETPYSN